jgi:hypothetical protein
MSKDPTSGPVGDGLVPVDSALGRHEKPELNLAFPPERTRVLTGLAHLDLLGDANVSAQLIDWLGRL